jgi:CelD/BcsL family acetyltransferase involved in cellulose biosynthesis
LGIEVELFDDLGAVERDAGGALNRERQASLYDTIDWLKLTREHVLPDVRLVAARARDDAGRSAWLLLQETAPKRGEAFASWYTLAFSPIFSAVDDQRPDVRLALVTALAGRLRPEFDRISLAPLDACHASLLRKGFGACSWLTNQSVATSNWVAETDGHSFETYWQKRPTRLRNTVARKQKRADLQIDILDRFSSQAWADYETVYEASWKPVEGSPAFVRALAERAAEWGALRLGIARRGGRPIAAQLWTVDGSTATIHKLAYDERAKSLSPGTLLTEAMFRHVIERDQPRVIDFGTGDDGYKADWMDVKRPLYRLDLFNRHSAAGLAGAARAAVSKLVRRARSD